MCGGDNAVRDGGENLLESRADVAAAVWESEDKEKAGERGCGGRGRKEERRRQEKKGQKKAKRRKLENGMK